MFRSSAKEPTANAQEQINNSEDDTESLGGAFATGKAKIEDDRARNQVDQIMDRHQMSAQQSRGYKTGDSDNHKHDAEKFADSFRHDSPPIRELRIKRLHSRKKLESPHSLRGFIQGGRI